MTTEENFVYDPKLIPLEAGCYLFYDLSNEIIYVGKAKSLRKRVTSYFRKNDKSPKTESLVKKICRIETRTVRTEMEALILENSLIKQHRPKYNILLRDDKNFLYLRVTNDDIPKIELTRRLIRDGSTYIGPRTSSKSFRKTIAFCQKFFGAKMVNASYDNYVSKLKGEKISSQVYRENIKRMKKFLRGDTKEVLGEIKQKMMDFAKARNFEAAAKMRDLLVAIDGSTQRQTIEFTDDVTPRDFVHFYRDKNKAFFVRMVFRNGKFVDQNELTFRAEEFASDGEIVAQFLLQFYPRVDTLPREIFVPALPEAIDTVIEFLQTPSPPCQGESKNEYKNTENRAVTNLTIHVPERGDKKKILDIAAVNAKNFAEKTHIEALSQAENFAKALPELTEILGIEQPIRRIECYDISHFAGHQTVASQVVFIDGQPHKNSYRRYKIETLKPGEIDDFASMQEVLGRRFARLIEDRSKTAIISDQVQDKKLVDPGSSISLKTVKTGKEWKNYHTFGKKLFALHRPDIKYNANHPDLKKEQNHPFLIMQNNTPIGFFRLDEKEETQIIFRTFLIDEIHRNKGIGTQVLKKIESWCLEKEKKSIVVNAHKEAFGFYEKNGFKTNFWKGDSTNEKCVPMGKNIVVQSIDSEFEIFTAESKADREKIFSLLDDIFVTENGVGIESAEKHFDPEKTVVFGVKKDGEIIGGIRGGKFERTTWKLGSLGIKKEFRKQGAGKLLLNHFWAVTQAHEAKKLIVLGNNKILDFYFDYGFSEIKKLTKKLEKHVLAAKEKLDEKDIKFTLLELKPNKEKKEKNIPEYPDLIVIDGGKGQLSSVLKILEPIMKSVSADQSEKKSWQFDISKNVIALAKREEEVFRGVVVSSNKKISVEFEQIDINPNSAASKLLQRTRDEAHRFAITFNRNLRAKSAMKSVLDEITGIGGRTKKNLLQAFGSVSGIRDASDEALLDIVNAKQLVSLRKQL